MALFLAFALVTGCGSEKADQGGHGGSGSAGKMESLGKGASADSVATVPETCDGRILEKWPTGEVYFKRHSRLLWVDTACGERVAAIRSIVGKDTLEKRFVLRDSAAFAAGGKLPAELKGAAVLRTPLKRVVALSSAQIGYMLRLGVEDRIVAVGEGKYIADSALYYRVKGNVPGVILSGAKARPEPAAKKDGNPGVILSKAKARPEPAAKKDGNPGVILSGAKNPVTATIEEIGYGNAMDFEKLIALKPDLVMTFATGGSQDDYSRLEALGLPAMLTSEWQEEGVWEKTYWLKLYGALFGTEVQADSILRAVAGAFVTSDSSERDSGACEGRKVLAGMSYGGVWYAPGGNSYTAKLIKEAGGCYLWAADTTRELRLTIEDVIALADSADMWVNPGMFGTPEEILAAEPRAAHIKAFKNRKVFQNDGRKGPGGGNDFFESAVARPSELIRNLRDLILADYGIPEDSSGAGIKTLPGLTSPVPSRSKEMPIKAQSEKSPYQWYHNIF